MKPYSKSQQKLVDRYSKFDFGILISFKSIFYAIKLVDENATEINEKHPKEELWMLWFNVMLIFYFLMFCSYKAFWVATGIFYFPYTYDLVVLSLCWKRFGYSRLQFWLASIATLVAGVAIMFLVHFYVFD